VFILKELLAHFMEVLILKKLTKFPSPAKMKTRQEAAALVDTFVQCVLYRIADYESRGILGAGPFSGSAQRILAIPVFST
jgi:hypothetical protein